MPPTYDEVAPITWPAARPAADPAQSAAFVFLHGLGDSGDAWQDLAMQFQKAGKHSTMQWLMPTAPENRDAMQTAWYRPTSLAPPPAGRPELAEEEDTEGLLASVKYVETLIDSLVAQGVPLDRIVLGGFSQGCALSLLTSLVSEKYSGKLAGVVGLMGYLPIPDAIPKMREEKGLQRVADTSPVFLARGKRDALIPRSKWRQTIESLETLGVQGEVVEVREYEGLGHSVSGAVMADLDKWLERVVPLETSSN